MRWMLPSAISSTGAARAAVRRADNGDVTTSSVTADVQRMPSWWIWMNRDKASMAFTDRGLFAHDQCHRAELVRPPRSDIRRPNSSTPGAGRQFEQTSEAGTAMGVRPFEATDRQPGLAHHLFGVEPGGPGDLGVMLKPALRMRSVMPRPCLSAIRAMSRNVKYSVPIGQMPGTGSYKYGAKLKHGRNARAQPSAARYGHFTSAAGAYPLNMIYSKSLPDRDYGVCGSAFQG